MEWWKEYIAMNFEEKIAITGVLAIVAFFLFINIRWTIRFWRNELPNKSVNSKSIKEIDNTQNDYACGNTRKNYVRLNKFNEFNNCPNNKCDKENN